METRNEREVMFAREKNATILETKRMSLMLPLKALPINIQLKQIIFPFRKLIASLSDLVGYK